MPSPTLLQQLASAHLPSRIWQRDPAAFVGTDAGSSITTAILNRLGWLDAPASMEAELPAVERFIAELQQEELTDVYLLGMGGSSLCAEVLRDILGSTNIRGRLTVLDTTDERAVRDVSEALVPEHACFLVASKSGSTIEVSSLERHFWQLMARTLDQKTGRHFAAITDPGTTLVEHATSLGYRHVFLNPADIGGRYSALSLFGLVSGAAAGVNLTPLLREARLMADLCRLDDEVNPGLALGAFMGGAAKGGRDKLTLLLPNALLPFGVWVEQLVAESTGKLGRGILPVVGEPIGGVLEYGTDRAFVAMLTSDSDHLRSLAADLRAAGHPVFEIEATQDTLGAELFRWEFATAVAGAILELNPFDEPNVRSAKEFTKAQLDARRRTGSFNIDPPFESGPGYRRREVRQDPGALTAGLGRYLAILDYLPVESRRTAVIDQLRSNLRRRTGLASTHGFGPRYLHSTGQYHKGGPNTGVFLLITAEDETATPIPDAGYTFSVLKQAQAFGDFDALVAANRSVIHYHFDDPHADFAAELEKVALGLL
jgi:glucose-6-phosphate isomerase